MLKSLQLKSKSIYALPKIAEEIQIALEAATKQLDLLCAFMWKPSTFDRNLLIKYMPNYSNQAYEMRLIQQECSRLYQTENLTPSMNQAIAALELESLKLERMSEKIIFMLKYFSAKTNHSQAADKLLINSSSKQLNLE